MPEETIKEPVNEVERDKRWADRFLPEIKSILGQYLIGEPPIEEDLKRNTDLMVLKMEAVRIGCRVRKYSFGVNFGDEFTIRVGRPSGAPTELAKIIAGWGDYLFYGFCNETEDALFRWTLADLTVFRLEFARKCIKLPQGIRPGRNIENVDGSSTFSIFRWSEFPEEFVIAKGETCTTQPQIKL